MKKILIISAMADVELDYLKSKLIDIKEQKENICTFYIGKMYNSEVILCDSNIGLINTASAVTLAIEMFKPDYIINQGSAGGFDKNIHKSDIVIGTQCINISSYVTKSREEGKGSNVEDWELVSFIVGEKDRLIKHEAGKELLEIVKKVETRYQDGKVHYGIIGSGDVWNKEYDRILYLNQKYGVLCEDMEGVAVYAVANKYNIPAIDVRVISDNEILNEEYERDISINSQKFVELIIAGIKSNS